MLLVIEYRNFAGVGGMLGEHDKPSPGPFSGAPGLNCKIVTASERLRLGWQSLP